MKLIAIDLDGTLLNNDKEISFKSKEYLMNLRKMGYVIVVATGRTLKSALMATEGAPFAHCIISNSGGVVFDNLNKTLLRRETISCDIAQGISNLYDKSMSAIEFNDLEYYNRQCEEFDYNPVLNKKIDNIQEFLKDKEDIYHISICFKNDKYAERISEYINKNFDVNSYTVRCSLSHKLYIEVLKKGVNKYSAISYVANLCGIPNEDIIAFGDSENDLEMIKNSGVGVAMGNAVESVKFNSDYVTVTNEENGVIAFLENYL